MSVTVRAAAAALAALAGLAGLAACGDDEPVTVPASEVEGWLEDEYYGTDDPDPAAVEVDCPGSLDAEEDATIRCEMERGDAYYEVELTVTSADDGEVEWDSEIVQRGY